MRTLTLVIGLMSFAAVAMGDSQKNGPTYSFEAEYLGSDGEMHPLSFSRAHSFKILGGAPMSKANSIKQYGPSKKKGVKYSVKNVDCRIVAIDMVQTLIGYGVDSKDSAKNPDGESRFFQYRGDDRINAALVARNLDKITVGKGEYSDFSCTRAEVPPTADSMYASEYGACAELDIRFKRRPLSKEVRKKAGIKDKFAIYFDKKQCSSSDLHCELMMQIEGCGLRYVLKGVNKYKENAKDVFSRVCHASNPSKLSEDDQILANEICDARTNGKGLSETLAKIAKDEMGARAQGRYNGITLEDDQARTRAGAPMEPIACYGSAEECALIAPPVSSGSDVQ